MGSSSRRRSPLHSWSDRATQDEDHGAGVRCQRVRRWKRLRRRPAGPRARVSNRHAVGRSVHAGQHDHQGRWDGGVCESVGGCSRRGLRHTGISYRGVRGRSPFLRRERSTISATFTPEWRRRSSLGNLGASVAVRECRTGHTPSRSYRRTRNTPSNNPGDRATPELHRQAIRALTSRP